MKITKNVRVIQILGEYAVLENSTTGTQVMVPIVRAGEKGK